MPPRKLKWRHLRQGLLHVKPRHAAENPEDAELYRREQYPKVEELLRPLLETHAKVHTFDVDTFTTHKIALGKAA